MIPRHSLPFGVRDVLSTLASCMPATVPSDFEKACADTLEAREVILLPSVRSGIHMAVEATEEGMPVVAPAYTCRTVYEALALSGALTRPVDSAHAAFLMAPDGISAATEPGCALVLSEVYGIPYDREALPKECLEKPRVRILDMAMNIPSSERVRQLEVGDVALFSFGWGKPLYAGWGGIACLQDLELAGRIRVLRDRWVTEDSLGLRFGRVCSILFKVAMNERHVCGLLHEARIYRLYQTLVSSRSGRHPAWAADRSGARSEGRTVRSFPSEWTRPTTVLNRKLALRNLRRSPQDADLRHRQSEMYFRLLVESGVVRGSGSKALPQSHFPVRFPAAIRDRMCHYLRSRGIDTSTLFPLAPGLSRDRYPHAAEAADEVVTLPLGPALTVNEVQTISGYVKEGLRTIGA